jgi:hypothetical protein
LRFIVWPRQKYPETFEAERAATYRGWTGLLHYGKIASSFE